MAPLGLISCISLLRGSRSDFGGKNSANSINSCAVSTSCLPPSVLFDPFNYQINQKNCIKSALWIHCDRCQMVCVWNMLCDRIHDPTKMDIILRDDDITMWLVLGCDNLEFTEAVILIVKQHIKQMSWERFDYCLFRRPSLLSICSLLGSAWWNTMTSSIVWGHQLAW